MVFALSGCANGDAFTEMSYIVGEREAEKITIRVADRELEIGASEDNRIYVDYFDGEKEYLDITLSDSKELTIQLISNREWYDLIGVKPPEKYRRIKMRLPDYLIATLSASTTNENIRINQLSVAEQISLETNGGNILCERVNVGKAICLTAKNGSITGSVIGGWDDFSISCTIKKGDCNLPASKESGVKSFTADCNNGDINIVFIKL